MERTMSKSLKKETNVSVPVFRFHDMLINLNL